MNLVQALAVKSAHERFMVISSIKDDATRELVMARFDEAERSWKDRLVSLVGAETAQPIFDEIDRMTTATV